MSELNIELPKLRPYARQGKAYYTELKVLHKELRNALKRDVEAIMHKNKKYVIRDHATLALRYRLNCAALASILEDEKLIPYGSYDRLRERGFRPVATLKDVWADMPEDERIEIIEAQNA